MQPPPLSAFRRVALTLGSAAIALTNPSRGDMVALVGDLTSGPALPRLVRRVEATAEGRDMIATRSPPRFPHKGDASLSQFRTLPDGSLGREYVRFMDTRRFSPHGRCPVRFVDDPAHVWLLQRYRDVHDLWHILTGLPTTILGETALKWFEAAHTGLPVAMLGAAAGPLNLPSHQRRVLVRHLIPWAVSCGRDAEDLLALRYEDYLDQPVADLRRRWRIAPPDVHIKAMHRRT